MIKVAIPGVNGRMGQAVASAVLQSADLRLVIATARDVEKIDRQIAASEVIITDKILNADFDVLIDFTLPDGVMTHLTYCLDHNRAMVIGSTGFTVEQLQQIQKAAQTIPILMSANMSIGVNICYKILAQAAPLFDENWHISISDVHHRHKKDSPSGTAKQMAAVINDHATKKFSAIAMQSERTGEVIGQHTVTFSNQLEKIMISHTAQDRTIFAQGSIIAARWVAKQTPGLYSMLDVIS